ncbi:MULTISPECIES: FkbM family methyltransferase [Bacillus]|uniref:FkbM family methyltransferase n=1 Tax=Bacillus TaxID=1386 RepID=UPI000BF181B1|nr:MULTISPECIES: FkbM family methyltransferase [Bacillus cereus group]MBJ8044282.1 FkbM family methyltransferase [Bacillus cereus group sp. N17]PEJ00654.1 methyltransferase FkbM [Bacillus toyonensis]PFZ67558.1 methyltransferase FkbM [Bacillus toyonensis]HDR3908621.1 FkbM family methyltransferase [Bacillus toyonensis]HDR7409229.1 FkbM family methyltransferase [Bacillus toyonensis]
MSSSLINVSKNKISFNVISNPMTQGVWDRINQNDWEEETFMIFDRFLNPANSYIDIGAWIGPTVLYGAHKAKQVYAIEPDPVAFKELITNLSLSPYIAPKITCINAAIAKQSGDINLYMRDQLGVSTSSLIPTISKKHCQVKAITLFELINRYNIRNINFIKMDIEGGEYSLVPSLYKFLKSQKPTLYVSLHPGFLNEHLNLLSNEKIPSLQEKVKIVTKKLLDNLHFYKYTYDIFGNLINKNTIINDSCTAELAYSEKTAYIFTNECW